MDTREDGAVSGLDDADELHTHICVVRPAPTASHSHVPPPGPSAVALTFPQAPSPITTIFSCLSWLSSSESDMAATRRAPAVAVQCPNLVRYNHEDVAESSLPSLPQRGLKTVGSEATGRHFHSDNGATLFGTAHSHSLHDRQLNV